MDEFRARQLLERARWPDGIVCPHCSSKGEETRLCGTSHREGLYQCQMCHRQFTVTVDTPFHRTRLPIAIWLRIMMLLKTEMSIRRIQVVLGISSYGTVYRAAMILKKLLRDSDHWLHALTRRPLSRGCVQEEPKSPVVTQPRKQTKHINWSRSCPWIN